MLPASSTATPRGSYRSLNGSTVCGGVATDADGKACATTYPPAATTAPTTRAAAPIATGLRLNHRSDGDGINGGAAPKSGLRATVMVYGAAKGLTRLPRSASGEVSPGWLTSDSSGRPTVSPQPAGGAVPH